MELLEALVVLFLCVVALGWAARQVRVPYLIMLVLGGVLLGFIPGLPQVPLDPSLILSIVLLPVLYQAALFTSWRDFRRHLRAISSLAIGLVLVTTLAVAVTVHFLIPTLPWAAACPRGDHLAPGCGRGDGCLKPLQAIQACRHDPRGRKPGERCLGPGALQVCRRRRRHWD